MNDARNRAPNAPRNGAPITTQIPLDYEPTTKLVTEQRSHVVARCHLEAGAGYELCDEVLFKGANRTKSPARRRIVTWALVHGYWRVVRPQNGLPNQERDFWAKFVADNRRKDAT